MLRAVAALLVGVVGGPPIHMRVAMGRHQRGMRDREHQIHMPLMVAKRLLGTLHLAHQILTRMVERRRHGVLPREHQIHTAQMTVDLRGMPMMAVGHRAPAGEGAGHRLHDQPRRNLGYVQVEWLFSGIPHFWI